MVKRPAYTRLKQWLDKPQCVGSTPTGTTNTNNTMPEEETPKPKTLVDRYMEIRREVYQKGPWGIMEPQVDEVAKIIFAAEQFKSPILALTR